MAFMNARVVLAAPFTNNWGEILEDKILEAFKEVDEDILKWKVLPITGVDGVTAGFLVIVENRSD
jgi:hypothetical protein